MTKTLDSARMMELFCAVANARYALEYWEREAEWASSPTPWARGPRQRGLQEIENLVEVEKFLRQFVRIRDNPQTGPEPATW